MASEFGVREDGNLVDDEGDPVGFNAGDEPLTLSESAGTDVGSRGSLEYRKSKRWRFLFVHTQAVLS